MNDIPTLTTARLQLRAFHEPDLDAYAAMCADAEVMRYIGTGGTVGREMAWRHMALFNGTWTLKGHGMWAVESRVGGGVVGGGVGRMIGRVGFLDPPDWPACELAWLLARDAWGRGLAFEAASAALEHARNTLRLERLVSLVRPDNQRSIALANRLGASAGEPVQLFGAPCLLFEYAMRQRRG